jgi:MFS family permease
MSKWLLRGLVFAALMVILRLVQGAMINAAETRAALISLVLVVFFAIVAFISGLLDGRADARANPDSDHREDLAMTWLLAGLLAGVVSGAVAWFIAMFYQSLYVEALLNEVTTFAAFTALLVFLMAMAGVALGRWLVDRKADQTPHLRHAQEDEDRADTDVFAAVRQPGQDDTGQTQPVSSQEQTRPTARPGEDRPR